jgi:starch synthase
MFKYYASQYPGLISSNILFSNELAHKIYAAADAFLMPSQFEPCGLSQLIAMRYGAVPIVRETGGLKETVIPFNEYSGEGTGFSFKNYDAEEMWNAIQYAREIYNDRTVWNSIARRGMAQDFSWEKSAAKYADLYTELLK